MQKNNHYEVYHIIEQTNDQQTVEVIAQCQSHAIGVYLQHSTHEEVEQVMRSGSNLIYDYPTETCISWEKTPNLLYAKWISKLGLY